MSSIRFPKGGSTVLGNRIPATWVGSACLSAEQLSAGLPEDVPCDTLLPSHPNLSLGGAPCLWSGFCPLSSGEVTPQLFRGQEASHVLGWSPQASQDCSVLRCVRKLRLRKGDLFPSSFWCLRWGFWREVGILSNGVLGV